VSKTIKKMEISIYKSNFEFIVCRYVYQNTLKGSTKFHSISKTFQFIFIYQPKRAKLKFWS